MAAFHMRSREFLTAERDGLAVAVEDAYGQILGTVRFPDGTRGYRVADTDSVVCIDSYTHVRDGLLVEFSERTADTY